MMAYLHSSISRVKKIIDEEGVIGLYELRNVNGKLVPRYTELLLTNRELKEILVHLGFDPINLCKTLK